jgi:hypothetical protein
VIAGVPGRRVVVVVERHGGDGARAFPRQRVLLCAFLLGEFIQACTGRRKGYGEGR